MINVQEVLDKAKESLIEYNARVLRNPHLSKELSGESKVVIEILVNALNKALEELQPQEDVVDPMRCPKEDDAEIIEDINEALDDAEEPKEHIEEDDYHF